MLIWHINIVNYFSIFSSNVFFPLVFFFSHHGFCHVFICIHFTIAIFARAFIRMGFRIFICLFWAVESFDVFTIWNMWMSQRTVNSKNSKRSFNWFDLLILGSKTMLKIIIFRFYAYYFWVSQFFFFLFAFVRSPIKPQSF